MMQIQDSNLLSLTNPQQKPKTARKDSKSAGRWTKEEHQRFVDGLKKFGKNWKQVEEYVATRNGAQIRSHAQKFFNRLERDFNLKFDDLNVQATKDSFNATLLKMSDYSYDHDDVNAKGKKSRKDSDKTDCSSPDAPTEVNSKFLSTFNSPKLDHFDNQAGKGLFAQSRKTSEEAKNYSLFDIIMSKIKSSNSTITSPKLSDLLDLSSSATRVTLEDTNMNLATEVNQQIMNVQNMFTSSFKLHSKKASEDDLMKLTQLRRPDYSDVEILSKKNKTN